jgi:hypothetical protein
VLESSGIWSWNLHEKEGELQDLCEKNYQHLTFKLLTLKPGKDILEHG